MINFLHRFRDSEDGAVTVDWVVLTAAVVGLAVVTVVSISESTDNVGSDVGNYLADFDVGP